jgi:signal transduction histidine kinase
MAKPDASSIPPELLFSVLENTPFGIIILNSEGKIHWVNAQAICLLNIQYHAGEIVNMEISEIVHEPIELLSPIYEHLIKMEKAFDVEDVFYNERYLTFRGRIIPGGMIITIADITNVKLTEFLSLNSMLEGQEMERKRLAREIHDGIGPQLSTLKMKLAGIESDLQKTSAETKDQFAKSYGLIDEVADDLRSISHNLLPKVLIDFGLTEALESLIDKIHGTKNIDISFISSIPKKRLHHVLELGIYRICQELTNNTLKHANAKKITLQLIQVDKLMRLTYEDDGVGFVRPDQSQGLGLLNIESRVKAFGGELNIDSVPGKGMTATMEIPINKKSYGAD